MSFVVPTTRFTRGQLPHWEVERGRYFVTVRCHDSLPAEIVAQLREINESLQTIDARSPQFAQLQRRYFLTMEKYLDRGQGDAVFRHVSAAQVLVRAFEALKLDGIAVPHYTIMPNHWHAMIAPTGDGTIDLHATMTHLKGRSARTINLALGRTGTLWQREWFDRWMRSAAEWDRCVEYIRQNPVKAGLVRDWRDHPWTK